MNFFAIFHSWRQLRCFGTILVVGGIRQVIEKLFYVPRGISSVMRQPVLSQDVYRDRKGNKRTELIESEKKT